jgi:TetR/AcrR family transcriptional regulator, cholesterol catabolism regulator
MRTRIVKSAADRRSELLDTALRLFLTHGYERVAVQDLTDAVGVAKGTFYHYFDSKAELLAEVCQWQAGVALAAAERTLAATPGDAVARLRAVITMLWGWKRDNPELAETYSRVLYSDENQALRLRLQGSLAEFHPLLTEIVAQGRAEGLFAVGDPAGATRAVMWLWAGLGEWMMPRLLAAVPGDPAVGDLLEATRASELACERILGAAEGSLCLYDYAELREWLAALVAALRAPAEPALPSDRSSA